MGYKYTHRDNDGMLWRWQGGRLISKLADLVMGDLKKQSKSKTKKKKA